MSRRIFPLLAASIAFWLNRGTPAMAASGFDHLVVLGDSLSDGGNAGRASNGPVWVEQLAARLGLPLAPSRAGGLNFAVGGARLDPGSGPNSLPAQARLYLGRVGGAPPGRVLHVVYGGGNDVLAALGRADGPALVDRAVASLRGVLEELLAAGAGDVLVPNLPDIGITPAVRAQGARAVAEAGALTARFNEGLDRVLAELAGRGLARLHRLDVRALAERVRADPAAAGLTDLATPCRNRPTCDGHLFWDDVHPTTRAHGRLAEAARDVVAP